MLRLNELDPVFCVRASDQPRRSAPLAARLVRAAIAASIGKVFCGWLRQGPASFGHLEALAWNQAIAADLLPGDGFTVTVQAGGSLSDLSPTGARWSQSANREAANHGPRDSATASGKPGGTCGFQPDWPRQAQGVMTGPAAEFVVQPVALRIRVQVR